MRIIFSTPLVEGYGLTESSAAVTCTSIHEQASLHHVGTPVGCNEVKLVSVPELGYRVSDTVHGRQEDDSGGAVTNAGIPCQGRGEVCFRGWNITSGYYKDPVKTADTLDDEGWLHSGDIGLIDSAGNLRIIDRKKNIFKLAQVRVA